MAGKQRRGSAYAAAGVDIDEMSGALKAVKRMVNGTATAGVRSNIGAFGGLFQSPGADALLVASTDGVGTKLKVATMANRHDTVGQDLVNHCVNDILVQGAMPLFFLDYLGTARLEAEVFKEVVKGFCKACRQNGCALLGGETAEMPGLYPRGEYDLVGTIVGAVPRREVITGEAIRAGDVLIGLKSSGFHTNGYSLVRQILFELDGLTPEDPYPGMKQSVADVLLAIHRSYLKPVRSVLEVVPVRGMAHITGGGLVDNLPRILPQGLEAVIDRSSWRVPTAFRYLEQRGEVLSDEMYRIFNMGIGYVIVVRADDGDAALKALSAARCPGTVIGEVRSGGGGACLD